MAIGRFDREKNIPRIYWLNINAAPQLPKAMNLQCTCGWRTMVSELSLSCLGVTSLCSLRRRSAFGMFLLEKFESAFSVFGHALLQNMSQEHSEDAEMEKTIQKRPTILRCPFRVFLRLITPRLLSIGRLRNGYRVCRPRLV